MMSEVKIMNRAVEELLDAALVRISHDTVFSSNPGAAREHSHYPHLIGLGEQALPWLLNRLEASSHDVAQSNFNLHCIFCALADISGDSPVIPESEQGKVEKIAQRWLEWGEAKGLRSE